MVARYSQCTALGPSQSIKAPTYNPTILRSPTLQNARTTVQVPGILYWYWYSELRVVIQERLQAGTDRTCDTWYDVLGVLVLQYSRGQVEVPYSGRSPCKTLRALRRERRN